jgi:hypothetical protein
MLNVQTWLKVAKPPDLKLAFRKKTNSSQISKLFALNNGLELQEDVRPRALG